MTSEDVGQKAVREMVLSRAAVTTDEICAHMGESNTKKVCKLPISCFNIGTLRNSQIDRNLGQT